MNLQNFVSAKVAEEFLSRVLAALPSVTKDAPTDAITEIVRTELSKLGDFVFNPGLDLRNIVARLCEKMMDQGVPTADEYEAKYAAARKDDDESATREINASAMAFASSISELVSKLRYDLPEKVEAICAEIREKADAGKAAMDTRTLTPANVFTWGALGDAMFANQVKAFCREGLNVFGMKTMNHEDEMLSRKMSTSIYPTSAAVNMRAAGDDVLGRLPMEARTDDVTYALKLLTDRLAASALCDFARGLTNPDVPTGRLGITEFTKRVTSAYIGLEQVENFLPTIEDSQYNEQIEIMLSRASALRNMLMYGFGVIQASREIYFVSTIVVPVPMRDGATGGPALPKGEMLYANGDLLETYRLELKNMGVDPEEALLDVTRFYYHYYINGTTIGATGLRLNRALDMRESVVKDVEAAVAADTNAAKLAENKSLCSAIDTVLTGVMKEKSAEQPRFADRLRSYHNARIDRMRLSVAHDVLALEEDVTKYLIEMEMNTALAALQANLSTALRYWAQENDNRDQVRALSFCQAIATTIIDFFKAVGQVRGDKLAA